MFLAGLGGFVQRYQPQKPQTVEKVTKKLLLAFGMIVILFHLRICAGKTTNINEYENYLFKHINSSRLNYFCSTYFLFFIFFIWWIPLQIIWMTVFKLQFCGFYLYFHGGNSIGLWQIMLLPWKYLKWLNLNKLFLRNCSFAQIFKNLSWLSCNCTLLNDLFNLF